MNSKTIISFIVYPGHRVTCSAIKRKQIRKRCTEQCVKIRVITLVTILVSTIMDKSSWEGVIT